MPDGMSVRAAARHFGISRESMKKMLCFSVPPGYRRTAPVRRPKLDGFTEIIDQWLKEDLNPDRTKSSLATGRHPYRSSITNDGATRASATGRRHRPGGT